MPPNASSDRYDPLPGFAEIPVWLYRKLSRRGRHVTLAIGALLLASLAVGLYFLIPAITETKHERAAAERKSDQEREAALVAQLKAEQRLIEGRGTPARGLHDGAELTARKALAADLAAAVQTDADARVRSGEFTHSVKRVECERYPRGVNAVDPASDLSSPTGRYSCLAVTVDAPRTQLSNASAIGYPYRALVNFPSGKYTFCKFSGRPGEMAFLRKIRAPVPRACGGGS